jgi:hypothetical protein
MKYKNGIFGGAGPMMAICFGASVIIVAPFVGLLIWIYIFYGMK